MSSAVMLSLLYQVLLYLNMFYFGMFSTCEILMKCVKAYNFPSSFATVSMEFALLLFLMTTEGIRIYLGRKGNSLDHGLPFLIGVALNVPCSLATLYFLFWQDRTLRLEQLLCGLELVLLTSELIVALMFLVAVYRRPPPEGWIFILNTNQRIPKIIIKDCAHKSFIYLFITQYLI